MNLADWLRRSPRPGLGEQLSLVAALARAVEEGHHAGRQYDGWSPASIEWDGSSVNLRALDVTAHPSPDLVYSAPETADGAPPNARSDVYSAGVLLYEILAGAHPFGGASVKQPRGIARPLSELRKDIPQDLADAVTACLERDPDWRPADLSFVLQVASEAAAKTSGKKAAPVPVSAPRTASAQRAERPMFGARAAPPPSRSRLPVLLAGILVAISVGVAYWTFGRSNGASPLNRPTPPPVVATPTLSVPADATDVAAASPSPTSSRSSSPRTLATSAVAASVTPTTAPIAPSAAVALTRATAEPVVTRVAVAPTVTPASVGSHPTEAPTVAPATPEPVVVPASLTSLSPLKLRRGANALLDVHGENLTANGVVAIARTKGRADATDVVVLRTKLASSTLLQVLVSVAANAPTGAYSLAVSDAQGRPSNALAFEIVQ